MTDGDKLVFIMMNGWMPYSYHEKMWFCEDVVAFDGFIIPHSLEKAYLHCIGDCGCLDVD
jgi:hypothetical protein